MSLTTWLREKRIARLLRYLAEVRGALRGIEEMTIRLKKLPLHLCEEQIESRKFEAYAVHMLRKLGVSEDVISQTGRRAD